MSKSNSVNLFELIGVAIIS